MRSIKEILDELGLHVDVCDQHIKKTQAKISQIYSEIIELNKLMEDKQDKK